MVAVATTTTTTVPPPVIELRRIDKDFPGVRALAGVSLEVGPGEVLGLIGENGAGKSTLMSVADNLLLGREVGRLGLVDDARSHAAASDLLRRVLGDAAQPAGAGPATEASGTPGASELMSLDLTAPVGQLGVGVQQLLEIARALGDHARLIILDEPTAALTETETETERLFALIRERRVAGTSFIYISHRLEEIAAVCDRVCVKRDGQNVAVRVEVVTADTVKPLIDSGFLTAADVPACAGRLAVAP